MTKKARISLSLLGIKDVIVINKMDLINYDKNKFADLNTNFKVLKEYKYKNHGNYSYFSLE